MSLQAIRMVSFPYTMLQRLCRAQLSARYLHMFLFPCLPSDAFRKLFPHCSLGCPLCAHSFPQPICTCSSSCTSSPTLFVSYLRDVPSVALLPRAAFRKLCAHVPLPVPPQRCFSLAISTIFSPLRSFGAQLSASYLHMFLFPYLFPSDAFRKLFPRFSLSPPCPAVRYRGPTGSETKPEPKHRRGFWEKIVYLDLSHTHLLNGSTFQSSF